MSESEKKSLAPQPKKRRPSRKRLGLDGYARIYVRLKRGASEEDLRIEGFVSSKYAVKVIIASLYKLGRIRVKEWRMPERRRMQAVYCHADALPDAEAPTMRQSGHPVRNPHIPTVDVVPSELLAFNSLLDAIEDRQATMRQIEERTGLNHATIRKALRSLMPSCAHVCGWVRSEGPMLAATYTLKSGMNVPKPVRSRAEHLRDYRRRRALKAGLLAAAPLQQMASILAANDERRAA